MYALPSLWSLCGSCILWHFLEGIANSEKVSHKRNAIRSTTVHTVAFCPGTKSLELQTTMTSTTAKTHPFTSYWVCWIDLRKQILLWNPRSRKCGIQGINNSFKKIYYLYDFDFINNHCCYIYEKNSCNNLLTTIKRTVKSTYMKLYNI